MTPTPDSPEGLTVEELARLKAWAAKRLSFCGSYEQSDGTIPGDRYAHVLALITQVERLTAERDREAAMHAEEKRQLAEKYIAWKTRAQAAETRADTLAAENERLSATIMRLVQASNSCGETGADCGVAQPKSACGCALEAAALSAGETTS